MAGGEDEVGTGRCRGTGRKEREEVPDEERGRRRGAGSRDLEAVETGRREGAGGRQSMGATGAGAAAAAAARGETDWRKGAEKEWTSTRVVANKKEGEVTRNSW